MSHFLARLVQRTRGELSTVRPVLPAVTAPDPTAAAWDEQVMIREAAPLAAAPQVRPSSTGLPFAEPRDEQRMIGEGLPPAMRARVPAARGVAMAESHGELDALGTAWSAAPVIGSPAQAGLPGTLDALPGAPAELPAPPPTSPGAPPPVTLRAPPPASREAPMVQRTPILASAAPARDAPASRVAPSATARRAGSAEPAPAPDPIAPRVSNASAVVRRPSTAAFPALDTDAMVADADARPAARESDSTAPIPAAMLGRPLHQVGPASASFSAPVHAPRPVLRQGHGAPAGLVRETATTVEVSIGRIEVRLPPRPQAPAGAAPPSTRRPVVGLAEYLRARETGKTP